MIDLKQLKIIGHHRSVATVKRLFGEIDLEFTGDMTYEGQHNHSFLLKKFPNYYKDSFGKKPLYVLVPDGKINCIWPDNIKRYSDIRYGCANEYIRFGPEKKKQFFSTRLTHALALHLIQGFGLYICLEPTNPQYLKVGELGI